MSRIALSFVLLTLIVSSTYATSCSSIPSSRSMQKLFDPAWFKSCVETVEANGSIINATIDTVTKALQSYVFRDAVRNSPHSDQLLHIQVDLLKALVRTLF